MSPEIPILMRDHFNRIKGQVVINRGGVQRFSILAREGWISGAEREEKGCVVRVIKPRGNSIQLGNCKKIKNKKQKKKKKKKKEREKR